jgi:hypothetical protein
MRLLVLIAALVIPAPSFAQTQDLHTPWDEILAKYLTEHPDGVNRFDYAGLRDAPADRAGLEDYIDALEASAPSQMQPDQAFAYWANLYNAVTVRLIVDEAPSIPFAKFVRACGPSGRGAWSVSRSKVRRCRLMTLSTA